jgi:hypothetical protein
MLRPMAKKNVNKFGGLVFWLLFYHIKQQVKPIKMKITKVVAGKYQVSIVGLPLPIFVSQRLNDNCAPSGEWNMFYGNEWMDTRCSKKDCIDIIHQMIHDGDLKKCCGI